MAATKADHMLGAKPFSSGDNPLSKGRKAPPQPAIEPAKMGPNRGKANSLAGIAAAAAVVSFTTTDARCVSNKTINADYTLRGK